MYQVVVDEQVLAAVVNRLVEGLDPDKIVLFGSRARGDNRPDSDLDLLIIAPSTEKPHRRPIAAYRAVSDLIVPKDIVWYTPEEVQEWSGVKYHLATRALREGRVLYEKQR